MNSADGTERKDGFDDSFGTKCRNSEWQCGWRYARQQQVTQQGNELSRSGLVQNCAVCHHSFCGGATGSPPSGILHPTRRCTGRKIQTTTYLTLLYILIQHVHLQLCCAKDIFTRVLRVFPLAWKMPSSLPLYIPHGLENTLQCCFGCQATNRLTHGPASVVHNISSIFYYTTACIDVTDIDHFYVGT